MRVAKIGPNPRLLDFLLLIRAGIGLGLMACAAVLWAGWVR